ncbi:MAG: CocE/NonD family hydrolase C-terminal non-catalytic domain-containing protein, partial [Halobacteria archaeon]|nr:CocE/NonD family hydrolase C-terminal non-catalytic domain-containing protein [Halobacteria archaeon]
NGGRQVDEGVWRGRETWPSVKDAGTLSFAVTPEGLQRTETFDSGTVERTYEVDHTVGLEAHDLSVPFVDTNADDARSMVFETSPLDHPIELTGTGEATVHLSVDGAVPLCVRLVDKAPDGRARPITRGSVRVEDADNPVTVPLAPVSHVVEEEHRLRVAISAADFPSHVPVGTEDSFTITSTPTSPTVIRIPGRDSLSENFEETLSMPPPDDAFPIVPPAIKGVDASWETTREHERGSATRRRQVSTDYVFPHVEKSYELDIEASIVHDDPSTLDARATIETVLEHDDGPVNVETTVHRYLDGTTVEATVRMDGEPVFEE